MTATALKKEEDHASATPAVSASTKMRKCLRCTTEFESAWPGERVCGNCKKTAAWRSGVSATPATNRR